MIDETLFDDALFAECDRIIDQLEKLVAIAQSGMIDRAICEDVVPRINEIGRMLKGQSAAPKKLILRTLRAATYFSDDAPRQGERRAQMQAVSLSLHDCLSSLLVVK